MKKRFSTYLYALLFLSFGVTEISYAQFGSFAQRKDYRIENANVSGSTAHTNFPVLFNITDLDFRTSANGGDILNNNGFDIAFTAADGTTPLDFEVESYNAATGNIIAWIRFPSVSSTEDTQFFIYYGDATITTDQSVTTTWDSNYKLVMHMDGVGATESDATLNVNNGTANGTGGIPRVTGRIGFARDFERNDADFISVPDANSLDITGNITLSFWYNQESAAAPDFISKGINLSYEATTRAGVRARFAKNGANNLDALVANNFVNSQWVYLTFVQSSSGRAIYQNGVSIISDANTTAFIANNNPLLISRSADAIDGLMDEVRVSNTNRSADWILTEYNNQLNPSTFISEITPPTLLDPDEAVNIVYTENDGAVQITSTITVTDPDPGNIQSATVSFGENYSLGEDFLNFSNTANITGSFASGSGILTLTGSDTPANYQAALRTITYENTSSDPVEINRTISFVANDGDNDSNTQTRTITVTAVNTKPLLTGIESSSLVYPGSAVEITNTIEVSDPDNTLLTEATVTISQNFVGAEDELTYSTLFGITGSWNGGTGVLTLTGNNLLSDFEAALRSVNYVNNAIIPSGTQRVVTFEVSDASLTSDPIERTINVSPVETVTGLEVWLRADAGISEGNGVPITTWADQSGNGNDYVGIADAGTAPTYIASSSLLNNQPSVRFAGNGDYFADTDGHTNYINNSQEFSLFVVYKSDITSSDRGLFIAKTPDNADDILTIRYDAIGANGSALNVVKTGLLANTAANQLESFADIQTTDAQIISLQWESNTVYDIYVDGTLNNPSAASANPPIGTITTATTAILGKGGKDDPQGANLSWDGEIAEFIYYSRSLTQTERESVEDYLSVKYNKVIREISPATGGTNISADDANTTFTALSGPSVQEGFVGEFASGGTFILTAPTGYEWNTTGIGVISSPAYGGSTTLAASYNSGSSSTTSLVFDVTAASNAGSNPGALDFTGLQIRPTTGIFPNTGNITNTGTTGQGGSTNYGTVKMIPGTSAGLIFSKQPTTSNISPGIIPEVRVQLVDQFGNNVEQSGVTVELALSSGTGNLNPPNPPAPSTTTNVLGIAQFNTLTIDAIGIKELQATSAGLTSVTSSAFQVVNAGTLTNFVVERVPSGNISAKTAGQAFNIRITAVDGIGDPVTTFNGTVSITSSCTLGSGQGTSANFSSGVLASTTVSITSVGNCTITATNSLGSQFGTSNSFNVTAGAASATTSIITALPTVILNDGITTSTITVDLKDAFGNNITTAGATVTLAITPTALGSIGSVTDNLNGTYSATVTSSTTVGTDIITGTVNAASITDNASVEYAVFTNIWTSQTGSASIASDWGNAGNWTGSVPNASDVIFIPATPANGNEEPVINTDRTIASLVMETGASVTVSGGSNLTITGSISGGSILGSNADFLTVGGDVLSVATINVGTVTLNGTSGAQSVTNPHSYTNLVINNTDGVSFEQNLTISGALTLTSGEMLIPSGKNLLFGSISYGTGTLRFQRAISGVRGWRIISSPVASTYGDFLDGTLTQGYTGSTLGSAPLDSLAPNVLTYLESQIGTDNQRYRTPGNATDALVGGQGVFVFFFGDVAADARYNDPLPDTLDVSGQEFNGPVSLPITYTAAADTGWNLVGNPFGASINWDNGANWTKTLIESTIYIWDPVANGGNGEYLTWNGATGSLGSGLIPSFQGFWVKATGLGAALTVTKTAKTTGGSFLRKEIKSKAVPEIPLLSLELHSNGLQKEMSFMFSEDALEGKDDLDAYELLPLTHNRLEIFSVLNDGTPLVINNLPIELTNRYLIPVDVNGYIDGFPISGDFKLRATNFDNIPEEWLISLVDNETNQEINLLEQEEYDFYHSTKNKAKVANPSRQQKVVAKKSGNARFTLKITTEEIEANIPESVFLDQNYPNPFNPSTTIPFGLNNSSKVSLIVYDILGRKVATLIDRTLSAGTYSESFSASNLASGVYFYRLDTGSTVITKKLTLIK